MRGWFGSKNVIYERREHLICEVLGERLPACSWRRFFGQGVFRRGPFAELIYAKYYGQLNESLFRGYPLNAVHVAAKRCTGCLDSNSVLMTVCERHRRVAAKINDCGPEAAGKGSLWSVIDGVGKCRPSLLLRDSQGPSKINVPHYAIVRKN